MILDETVRNTASEHSQILPAKPASSDEAAAWHLTSRLEDQPALAPDAASHRFHRNCMKQQILEPRATNQKFRRE